MAFAELCESEHLADIVLVVEGCRIPAHKAVLFARSQYFNRMFAASSAFQEGQPDVRQRRASVGRSIYCLCHIRYDYNTFLPAAQMAIFNNSPHSGGPT